MKVEPLYACHVFGQYQYVLPNCSAFPFAYPASHPSLPMFSMDAPTAARWWR
jgi:hypothetical protein